MKLIKNMNHNTYLKPHIKINSISILDLNTKYKIITFLEENIEYLCGLKLEILTCKKLWKCTKIEG